jgi:pimeloyl-ACP methyl ester carboxylesterase
MPEVHINGVRLYYEEHGVGPPILCIHGTGGSALMWGATVPELARLGRVIVYDRRGCTRSQRPDPYDKTSVAEHADDAAALLDALGVAPAAVIGRSYGGEIATDLALRYPERVRGLVLLEGASLSLSAEAAAWEEALRRRVQAAAADDLTTVGETFIRGVLGDTAWDGFPGPVRKMFTDNSPAILAEVTGGPLQVDQTALASVDKPTLLVAAAHSPEAFRQVTDAMATAMPNSRKYTVEGGHLINPADPAVLSFLQELPR